MTKHIHKFGSVIRKLERIETDEGLMVTEITLRFSSITEKDMAISKILGLNQSVMLVVTD